MPSAKHRSHRALRNPTAELKTAPLLEDRPVIPWSLAAIGGGLGAVLGGALVVAAVVLIAWMGAPALPFDQVLAATGRLWLLAHGAPMAALGTTISLVPLGLTVVMLVFTFSLSAFALTQGVLTRPDVLTRSRLRRLVVLTAVLFVVGYTVGAILISVLLGEGLTASVGAAAGIAAIGSLAGAGWSAGYRLAGPAWLRASLKGAATSVLALVAAAAVALIVAVNQGEPRISDLERVLGLDATGSVVWALVCLMYLPTLLGWTASWLLGGGFTLGEGTLVAPWVTQLGMLPTIPVFGALPTAGVGGLEPWLVTGLVVGGLGGVVAVHCAPSPIGTAIATGGLSGLLAGAVFLAWAWFSTGGLGVDRFATVGPRWPEVLIGVGILVGSAVTAAVITWFVRAARSSAD